MGAAFLIPTIISALGTGAEYVNQSQANSRQNAAEVQATADQQAYKNRAAGATNQFTQQIAHSNPTQLADKATAQYIQQLRQNVGSGTQANPESALTPQAGASKRYATDSKTAQGVIQSFGNTLAAEKGHTDAAVRQRQNEGLDMGTLATQLTGLNSDSYATNFVDQLRAQAAGTKNPWVTAVAGAMQNYGNAKSANTPLPGTAPVNPALMPGSNGYNLWGAPLDAGNAGYGVPTGNYA